MDSTREGPEKTADRLATRLSRQRFWDALLTVFPPFAAVFYVAGFAFYLGLLSAPGLWIVSGGALAVFLACLFFFRGGGLSSPRQAAALLDAKAQAQDRFVTLVTVKPAAAPAFYDRLRKEAAGLMHRVSLRNDFPYRIKRSFMGSLAVSFVLIAVFHLLFHFLFLSRPAASPAADLARAARELAKEPRFAALARGFEALIAKIEQGGLAEQEKAALVQDLTKQLQQKDQDQSGSDLLNRAENALRGLEKGEQQRREDAKGGGASANLPDEGEGKEKSEQGGADGEDRQQAMLESREMKGEKSPRDATKDDSKGKGEGKGRGESMSPQGESKKETEGTARRETEGKGSRADQTDIPSGQAPQERFYKPGEGGEGIKGARYVTVELPEVGSAASGSGEGEEKKRPAKSKIPVSNVPLSPASAPDLPREKQPLPLEYESLIR